MRIVAGSARGRRLVVPDGTTTRPTTDRVREATFNALFSLDAIEGAAFCDLFAGSGALGLEALSRGAAHCTFVERDRAALAALRANIDTLDMADETRVVTSDAVRWIAGAGHFDVVLLDPPYDFDAWPELLASIDADLVVVESDQPLERLAPDLAGWTTIRERSYGSTVVALLQPRSPQETP